MELTEDIQYSGKIKQAVRSSSFCLWFPLPVNQGVQSSMCTQAVQFPRASQEELLTALTVIVMLKNP